MATRILIVDDALFMRKVLSDVFQKEGFEICGEAGSGPEGVKKFSALKPDLITMDIVMPEMDQLSGIDAIREIIKIDPKAKIIIVSSMGQQALISESIQAGAKDFIIKPFNGAKVLEVVKRVLGTFQG